MGRSSYVRGDAPATAHGACNNEFFNNPRRAGMLDGSSGPIADIPCGNVHRAENTYYGRASFHGACVLPVDIDVACVHARLETKQ
jgi:hypothetical protein